MGRVRAHGTPVRRSLNRSLWSFEIQVVTLYQMAQRASLTLLITHYSGSMLLGPTQPLTFTLYITYRAPNAPPSTTERPNGMGHLYPIPMPTEDHTCQLCQWQ